MGPPHVGRNLESFAGACGFERNVAQPRCIGPLEVEASRNTRALCRPRGCAKFRQ
jgi:hypothetical protein